MILHYLQWKIYLTNLPPNLYFLMLIKFKLSKIYHSESELPNILKPFEDLLYYIPNDKKLVASVFKL